MEFIINPLANEIKYETERGKYPGKHSGKYVIRSITVTLTSDDPGDLLIMTKHKKPIEKAIMNELNKTFSKIKEEK